MFDFPNQVFFNCFYVFIIKIIIPISTISIVVFKKKKEK